MCGEVVHSYGIEEAIRDGYLSRYFYNIERVTLTEKETEEYDSRMDQIKRLLQMFAEEDGPIDFAKAPEGCSTEDLRCEGDNKEGREQQS